MLETIIEDENDPDSIANILPLRQMGSGLGRYLNEQYIPFRCQKGMTGSETFSNSTTSNPLADELNSQATENDEGTAETGFSQALKKKVLKFAGNFSDRAAIMAGRGRITLPDVFESSSFSRSITCSFEFHSPYGNEFIVVDKEGNIYNWRFEHYKRGKLPKNSIIKFTFKQIKIY